MANPDRPNGFRPVKSLNGAPWTALIRRYQVADNSSLSSGSPPHGNIGIGDVVKLTSGLAVPAITGNTIAGVVVGVGYGTDIDHGSTGMFIASNLEKTYITAAESATGTWYVWVVPARDAIFEVQSASDLDYVVGGTADIAIASTSVAHMSTTTGMSTTEVTTSSNADVTIVEVPEYIDNDATLANTRYWVKFATTTP